MDNDGITNTKNFNKLITKGRTEIVWGEIFLPKGVYVRFHLFQKNVSGLLF